MSFSEEEVLGALRKIPSDGFLAESAEVQTKCFHLVASVDADPKNLHDVMFHAIVARTLAEVMGSAQPADYAVPHMPSLTGHGIKVGAAPFEKKSEDVTWRSVKVVPAYATLAFRVQAKAVVQHVPPSASAVPGGDALAQVMHQYVQINKRSWTEVARKVRCHTTWKHVSGKVALSSLPDFPTEDVMILLKSAFIAAHAQGRQCVSSAEARSPSEFRPTIDVLVNDGSLEEKIRGALHARKQRSQQDRVDFSQLCQLSETCASLGRQDGRHENLGPSPFDRVPVDLVPSDRRDRRGLYCVLLQSPSAPEAGERT